MRKTSFVNSDFLLQARQGRRLYHEFAEGLPIVDYHSHLPPSDIAADRRWENLAQLWLGGDHYKWRAMRANGVAERYCTGDATDWEKFLKWAETMPRLLRNPLYHWTHLELKRYFGVDDLLGPKTARKIWDTCNRKLAGSDFSCRRLMERMKVVLVCTTDDPADSLEHHQALARERAFKVKVLPTWRPDKGMAVENPVAFNAWVDRLETAAGRSIRDFDGYRDALLERHRFFHRQGCRLSDHGLATIYADAYTEAGIRKIFRKVRGGKTLSADDVLKFRSAMLYEFAVMDAEKGWTQQYHLGVLRNANSRMMAKLGPDTGFDAIGDFEIGRPLARLLDRLSGDGKLTKTIVYNINPRDNALMATLMGSFQDGSAPGKMQWGSGWWFLDQKRGMEEQIETLSQMGVLGRFVGMLTDSRSFLSFTRHEYFRRILCNVLGTDMRDGMIPEDYPLVGGMVRDICYRNAASYFGFSLP